MRDVQVPGSFADWLKARRKALDLTQEELASRAGCSVFALRKIESGERRPSKQLVGLLAAALEIQEEEKRTFIKMARGEVNPDRLRAPVAEASSGSPAELRPVPPPLPFPPTPLLGRDPELAALERLFNDPQCRLLTLTGMGGIGKTRLAIEFALRERALFPDGVYYIPLASINEAELIVPAVAEAFGFSFSGPVDLKEQLIKYLSGTLQGSFLLVLDNLEHLISPPAEAVELVSEFLQRLPCLKILATSRERLNLRGEWMYELHGLSLPPTEFVDRLEDYSAAALFLQCARRVKPDFVITAGEKPALVRICHLLEGIPLAIELAAAWSGMLSCTEIAYEIESNIDFLETTMRNIPERHRSLRASFDHSWKLLSGEEQNALCRLAVFQGGFDRNAAEQVAGATLALLASLVSKSLVRRAGTGRYDLHEVIRQFALSHLDEDRSRQQEARDAHCEYYLQFAAAREKALRSAPQRNAVRELINEIDNLRAAWVWAIRREKFSQLGASVRSLGWFFEVSGLIQEGIEQFEPLVRVLKSKPQLLEWHWALGLALTQQGMLYFRKGHFDRAQALMEESLAVLRPLGRVSLLTDSLVYLGIVMHLNGDLERSRKLLEEGLACARSTGDDWFVAYAVYNLGYVDSLMGRYAEGREQMLEGMSIWRRLGDPHSIALGLNYLGPTLVKLGDYEQAESFLQESLSLCNESGNRWGKGTAYRYLALVKLAQGHLKEAESLLYQSLETFSDYIVGWDIARSFTYLGDTLLEVGDLAGARKTYLEALRLSREASSMPLVLDSLTGLAHVAALSAEQEKAFELAEFVLYHTATTQYTKDRAHQIQGIVEKDLDGEKARLIRERVLEQTVESVLTRFSWPHEDRSCGDRSKAQPLPAGSPTIDG